MLLPQPSAGFLSSDIASSKQWETSDDLPPGIGWATSSSKANRYDQASLRLPWKSCNTEPRVLDHVTLSHASSITLGETLGETCHLRGESLPFARV